MVEFVSQRLTDGNSKDSNLHGWQFSNADARGAGPVTFKTIFRGVIYGYIPIYGACHDNYTYTIWL